jgi:tetratricopeptide (TPR) repeat protein
MSRMRHRDLCRSVPLTLVLCWGATVLAQQPEPAAPSEPTESTEKTASESESESIKTELAKKHYELGEKLYQTSAYQEALQEFEKAYKLEARPALLFNIARCHEVMGQLEQAVSNYELYLKRDPYASNRSVVESRVANLKRRLKQQPAKPPAAAEPPQPPQPPPPAPGPTERPASWRATTGWIALGVGAAALGTGIAFTVLAASKADEYESGVKEGKLYYELEEIDNTGAQYEKVQISMLVVGGVGVAAGAGLLLWHYLTPRGDGRRATVLPFATADGMGITGQVRF